ncbi:MAG: SBBP repeat-containing protein [Acidobacteria bacterium]|nr:SBBP repeat-containing protein [Acidobacteriota bacterium]
MPDPNLLHYPVTQGAFDGSHNGFFDAYVTQLNATGSALIYSTYIGGPGIDEGNALAIDPVGNAYVTGSTSSDTFPTTSGAFDTTRNGGADLFVTKLGNATTSCSYSLSPTNATIAAAGTTGSFGVETGNGCAWTAVSNAGWITTSSTGSGNGTVSYSVAPNPGGVRSGTITVGGQQFTVNQSASAANCTPPPANLISWYKAEGNAGDVLETNTGLLQNGATFGTGKVGQAFSLDGTNDYVRVADSPSLRPVNLTLEGWVNFTSTSGTRAIFSKSVGSATLDSFAVYYSGGELFGTVGDSVLSGTNRIAAPFNPVVGTWYHIAYTFDDSTNIQVLYINGVAITTGTTPKSMGFDNKPFLIGADNDNGIEGTVPFHGLIDEASIYSRALTANEILTVYNSGSDGKMSPTSFVPK